MAEVQRDRISPPLSLRRGVEPQVLAARLSALFGSSDYRPPVLPAVAMELVAIARQPDVPIPTVVKLLKNEQMLTARLLTLSQSSIYGRSFGPTMTLGQVILRLGLKRVADIFVQASMEVRMFRARGFEQPMNRLRRHSAATAEMSRLVCQRLSLDDDHAFLCGLLHDVGLAAAIIAISEGAAGEAVEFGHAWPAIFDVHEAAGRRLAELWRLPTELGMVIGSHHGTRPFPSDTAAAVALADQLVSEHGAGIESECEPAALTAAVTRLNLGADALTQLRQDAARVVSSLT